MNINELVPDYKTCLEAKELGFPQDMALQSYKDGPINFTLLPVDNMFTARPTLQELYAVLPDEVEFNAFNVNPVQVALELWIKLKKDGVI